MDLPRYLQQNYHVKGNFFMPYLQSLEAYQSNIHIFTIGVYNTLSIYAQILPIQSFDTSNVIHFLLQTQKLWYMRILYISKFPFIQYRLTQRSTHDWLISYSDMRINILKERWVLIRMIHNFSFFCVHFYTVVISLIY
jgi:hypothetical protein